MHQLLTNKIPITEWPITHLHCVKNLYVYIWLAIQISVTGWPMNYHSDTDITEIAVYECPMMNPSLTAQGNIEILSVNGEEIICYE